MREIKKSRSGLDYLLGILEEKARVVTRVAFWKVPHNTREPDINLKVGRYLKDEFGGEEVEKKNPKSELTLNNNEFLALIEFLRENYEPFKEGVRKFIPIKDTFNEKSIDHLKALFNNPNREEILHFIIENDIVPHEILESLEYQKRKDSIKQYENMLKEDLVEQEWQVWFQSNDWVLGSEFVRILDERDIDTENISDYLMQAYDGFLDIVEIKRPAGNLKFWSDSLDHGNYYPSAHLSKAIMQATNYIHEVEREANSVKFLERLDGVKVVKPRCFLIFGRSDDWNKKQQEAYRILNSSFHNLTILTYDHVLRRAKRILNFCDFELDEQEENDIPF